MNSFQPDMPDLGTDLERLLQAYDSGLEALRAQSGTDVLAQVQARKKLATRLGLGQRLLRTYDELKFVPDQRRGVLAQWGCTVHGQEVQSAERATVVRFDLKQKPYLLTFRGAPVSYEDVYAYLDLCTTTGEVVFSVHVKLDVDESSRQWVPIGVEAFVPGDWVKDMLEFSIRLALEREAREDDTKSRELEDLKKKFGLI